MSEPGDLRLQRLLGGEHLAALRKRLRRRFERAPMGRPVEHIRIVGLNADEHSALASLIGRPQRFSDSLGVDVRLVDASLRQAGIAPSLRDALERLDGPIVDLVSERLRAQALWTSVVEGCRHPALVGLLQVPNNVGLVKRLAKQEPTIATSLCRNVEAILGRLPVAGLTRSQLAAEELGDAHGLDDGRPVATLVLAALRRAGGPTQADEATEITSDAQGQPTAERTRDTWASAGVLVNELARPALFLNLPTEEVESWSRGEPSYVSLRLLLRSPPRWNVLGRTVRLCENPNLVAIAADRLGRRCAPLVCTDGMPGAAQRCMLSQLVKAGAELRYHGDFDWPGLHIGNLILREYGAQPWRFGPADYITAIQSARRGDQSLDERPVEATWDRALTAAMQRHRIPIAEEAVAADLLQDLDERSELSPRSLPDDSERPIES